MAKIAWLQVLDVWPHLTKSIAKATKPLSGGGRTYASLLLIGLSASNSFVHLI